MAHFKIKIVEEQHFIEGNRYHAFLEQEQGSDWAHMILACDIQSDEYLDMCEKLGGLKCRLEQLGNKVEVVTRFDPDPNFETKADADEYIMNKGA